MARFRFAPDTNPGVRQRWTLLTAYSWQHEENDAVLLMDVSKAFNSLNRTAALRNISILCPALAAFAMNAYRAPARPFVTGSKELISAESTIYTKGSSSKEHEFPRSTASHLSLISSEPS